MYEPGIGVAKLGIKNKFHMGFLRYISYDFHMEPVSPLIFDFRASV